MLKSPRSVSRLLEELACKADDITGACDAGLPIRATIKECSNNMANIKSVDGPKKEEQILTGRADATIEGFVFFVGEEPSMKRGIRCNTTRERGFLEWLELLDGGLNELHVNIQMRGSNYRRREQMDHNNPPSLGVRLIIPQLLASHIYWRDSHLSVPIALSTGGGGPVVVRQLYVGLITGRSQVRFSPATHQSCKLQWK